MKTATLAATVLTAVPALAQSLSMEPVAVKDPMVWNIDAVKFLKPKGWKVDGGIKWYPDSLHQVCLETRIANPDGLEQIETLPWAYGCWFTRPVVPMAEGTNYQGQVVLRPIEDPREVLEKLTLPAVRARYRPKVTRYQDMPEVAKAHAAAMGGARVRSGRLRIEYVLNGKEVEEDFYLSVFVTSYPLGVNDCIAYSWGPVGVPFSLRAAKGKLDAATPLMLASVNSLQIEKKWFGEYMYVCDLFKARVMQGIRNAVEISETVRKNSDAVFKMYSDAYWSRAASQDRISQQFSDYIRGVQRYDSPYEKYPVQLPSGYKYAWTTANGSMILSNEAGFNPNVGDTRTWQLMKEAKP
jgi:hypothetical protein